MIQLIYKDWGGNNMKKRPVTTLFMLSSVDGKISEVRAASRMPKIISSNNNMKKL